MTDDPTTTIGPPTGESAAAMADAIEAYVRRSGGGATFVDFENHIPGFSGDDYRISFTGEASNIVLWQGMTETGVAALEILRKAQRIVPVPTSILTYYADGKVLTYPLAKRPPKGGYTTDHWAPLCWDIPEDQR